MIEPAVPPATRPDAGAAARAAELDALEEWTGLDPQGRAARAAEVELAAANAGDTAALMRARLIQADSAERAGELKSAVAVMWQINEWAKAHGHRYLIARTHLLLGRTYRNMGDVAALLEHAVAAVEALDDSVPARRRLPYVVKYADALTETGSIEAARLRYRQAEELARHSDIRDQIMVLNNHAYAECLAGDPSRAWLVVERMLALAAAHGHRLDPNDLDTIASVQIELGRFTEAEQTVLDAIAAYPDGHQEADALPEFLLTLAATRRRQGASAAAQQSLDECRELCAAHGHTEIGVRVRQEQAELYAMAGDYARAFAEYKAFHAAERDVLSAQREAQARIRQSLFEVEEARQDADRFREQARRDPMTGLRNRRYVDEHLPALIDRSVADGTPLWVAVLDLDHFKQINDHCSHEAGDQVLIAVAGLLAEAAVAPGFAARLGGEEFLLVVAGLERGEMVTLLEDVRTTVAGHPWRPITGDRPVTVSVGAAPATAGSTQATLSAAADALLYQAKRDGRNRICLDPPPAGGPETRMTPAPGSATVGG